MPGGQLVRPVPGERHHPHALVVDGLYPLQPSGQRRAALHGEEPRKLFLRYGPLHLRKGAAFRHAVPELLRLPVEAGGIAVKEGHCVVPPLIVRHKDGKALYPFRPRRNLPKSQLKPRMIQRIPLRGQISGQRIAVKIEQSGHSAPPLRRPDGGCRCRNYSTVPHRMQDGTLLPPGPKNFFYIRISVGCNSLPFLV